MTRNARIALMRQRGEEWRKANPQKVVTIWIKNNHVAHHLMVRLTIYDAADLKEIICNRHGWEFLKALDPDDSLRPTIAMLLAVLDKLSEVPDHAS